MTILHAIHWLASGRAKLSLIGAQVGRIHVRGVVVPDAVAETLAQHRELVSLLLVQEYGWTGDTEVEAAELARHLDNLNAWLRSLPPTASLARAEADSSMRQMAVAMLQDLEVDACDALALANLLDGQTAEREAA